MLKCATTVYDNTQSYSMSIVSVFGFDWLSDIIKNMKKIYFAIILIILIIATVFVFFKITNNKKTSETLVIGAILPMTGSSAIYGEELKKGMEYAIRDLEKNTGDKKIKLIVEDSQATAQGGLTAYNKLVNSDNADFIISAFSRVSVPLTQKAKEDNVPLIITMVAAMSAVSQDNPWVFRVFQNAAQTGGAHSNIYTKLGIKKLGVLYVNDEMGLSNFEVIQKDCKDRDIEVLGLSYLPTDSDYKTQLSKIKSFNPDGLVFIGIPPSAVYNARQQAISLGLNIPFFEPAGVLQISSSIKLLGSMANGIYSIGNPFNFMETGSDLKKKIMEETGREPSYSISFGYDSVKIIGEVSQMGKYKKEAFITQLKNLKTFSGTNSSYNLDGKGEISPTVYPAKVVNEKLEKAI